MAHLRERGRLGIADPEVLELAFAEDRVLVTANVGDFRKLAAAREVHSGIVLLLDGGLRRYEQLEVLRRVIVALEADADLVNRALTVALDGGFRIEELPLTTPKGARGRGGTTTALRAASRRSRTRTSPPCSDG